MEKIKIFIGGTDTGVGKTVVTGLLSRFLIDKGYNAVTQKWVQTGSYDHSADIQEHLNYMRRSKDDYEGYSEDIMPYIFKYPASPHLAAKLETIEIDNSKIERSFNVLYDRYDAVIVEGTGGMLVPYNEDRTLADICEKIEIPTILVVENRLGAINHALLSIESIRKRNIPIIGMIFNKISSCEDELILNDNMRIINKLTGIDILGELDCLNDREGLYHLFTDIGQKIIDMIALNREMF